ncbi:MAG: hypothetical protein WAO91_00515 [Candidatus Nitrosotenuis sp.]
MANRHTVIVLASIAVTAATPGYSLPSLVFAKYLQFGWHQCGSFDLLSTMFGGKLIVCNNSYYPPSFHQPSFDIICDGQSLGVFSAYGMTVPAHPSTAIDGKFSTNDERVAKILFSSLDTVFSGSGQAARIDINKMSATTTFDTKIIWAIPFSTTREYSGQEFVDMMNQKTGCGK